MKLSEIKKIVHEELGIKPKLHTEAKKKDTEVDKETDIEQDMDVDMEIESPEIEGDENMEPAKVDPNIKSIQDALTQAQAAAKQLGDQKLTDQIGNTITFFTRQHISGTEVNEEELFENRMKKIAGIIK